MTDPRQGGGYNGGGYGYGGYEPEPKRGGSSLPWVITALVVAIIVAVGAVAVMWLIGRGPQDPTPSAADDFTTASHAESTEAEPSPATTNTDPATSAPQMTEAPPSPATPTRPSDSYPAGLTARGWEGTLNCNASDDWVYAGSNGSDYALVCVATPGGGLYYKGIFRGGEAEHDIATQSGVGTPNAYFATADLGDSTIAISGSDLYVYDSDGAILAQTTFGQVYAQ